MHPAKPHLEFHAVDMNAGWSTPPGYPAGIQKAGLAGRVFRLCSRRLREYLNAAKFVRSYRNPTVDPEKLGTKERKIASDRGTCMYSNR